MDWEASDPAGRPTPIRQASKRALSSSPPQPEHFASLLDTSKRVRSSSTVHPDIAAALAAHQALFDSHIVPPSDWSDLSKRVGHVQREISSHPERVKAWTTAALQEANSARDAEAQGDVAGKLRHVDACTALIGRAQEERRLSRSAIMEQLGAPWNEEEERFRRTLATLDEAEDRVVRQVTS